MFLLSLLLIVVSFGVFVPHVRSPSYIYMSHFPNGTSYFPCRRADLRRCSSQERLEKMQRLRPGAFFLERHFGVRETTRVLDAAYVWLEIPLEQVGNGFDVDFSQLSDGAVVNRFPGLARNLNAKDGFARNAKRFGDEDLVFPETHVAEDVESVQWNGGLWLCKPAYGGAGKGIFLVNNHDAWNRCVELCNLKRSDSERYILQKYIEKPYLVNGYRHTLRLYGMITSLAAGNVKAYLNGVEGIVKYNVATFNERSLSEEGAILMQEHYRVGQEHDNHAERKGVVGNCTEGRCIGTRWDLQGYWSHMDASYEQDSKLRRPKLWSTIHKCVAGALRAAIKGNGVEHRAGAFQALGIDVDVDENGQVYFLEANVTPALGYQTDWEKEQKERMFESMASLIKGGTPQDWEQLHV